MEELGRTDLTRRARRLWLDHLIWAPGEAGRRAERLGGRGRDASEERRIAAGGGTVVSPQRPRLITRQVDPCRSAVIAATASS